MFNYGTFTTSQLPHARAARLLKAIVYNHTDRLWLHYLLHYLLSN